MATPFDHIANNYDRVFTNSAVGQLQRKQVWQYLESMLSQLDGLEILELNCGTGEDAVLFGEKGFNVIATDISAEMLKATEIKAHRLSMKHRVTSQYLDLENFSDILFDKKFDLIFSNFGGLNCISPAAMRKLLDRLPLLLNPNGRFVGVIMPKFCLWEGLYFLCKFQFGKIFRRWTSQEVIADLHGSDVRTWYYSPGQIEEWSISGFKTRNVRPVGLALPPSYLNPFLDKRRKTLRLLYSMEQRLSTIGFFSRMSDHFIIDLQLR
jgi:ubiquinone/menaquinone biosynthesis C-methylase UbiE